MKDYNKVNTYRLNRQTTVMTGHSLHNITSRVINLERLGRNVWCGGGHPCSAELRFKCHVRSFLLNGDLNLILVYPFSHLAWPVSLVVRDPDC